MTQQPPWRIIIADDHQLFIDGIRLVLSTAPQFQVVGEANDGKRALELLAEMPVDAVVLDINMPEMDGVETAKAIRANFPDVKILMLTMHSQDIFIKRLMRLGVDSYILKENGQKELVTALEAICKGRKHFAQEVTQSVMDSFQPMSRNEGIHKVELTAREKEVLRMVAQEMTAQEIADALFIAQSTVISHRKNIMRKLDVRNAAGMVRLASELGLID